eukprot:11735324-Heterocapsa_arctica.AAC.1
MRSLSAALGYDSDHGTHFILDEETVYRQLSGFDEVQNAINTESSMHDGHKLNMNGTPTFN